MILGVVVVVTVGFAVWRAWRTPAAGSIPVAGATAWRDPLATPGRKLAERAYRLTQKVTLTRDDLEAADALVLRAIEMEPESPRAWAVRAWVQAAYLHRNFDGAAKRRQRTEAIARRALALDGQAADALNSLAVVMAAQRDVAGAREQLLRRATKAEPDNRNSAILLASALDAQDRLDEARNILTEVIRRDPRDVLAHFALAEIYAPFTRGRGAETLPLALQELDAAIALQPFEGALALKATLAVSWRGDLPAMRAALEQLEKLPPEERSTDRAVFATMWCGLLDRDLSRVLRAAAWTTRPYLEDSNVIMAKDYFVGLAYHAAGKENLAQQHWRAAEAAVRESIREHPGDPSDELRLAIVLFSLGRREEGAGALATFEAAWREELTQGRARLLLVAYAAAGDGESAAFYLERCINSHTHVTDHTIPLDPRWDRVRSHPAFEGVLAKARQRVAAAKVESHIGLTGDTKIPLPATPAPDPKSIVVLPFANLSGDPAQEYFSDGVTEEILNALMRERDLRVVPRTSAFSFKDKKLTLAEIARALDVAQVVDGSVRRAGNQVRINCTVTRAADSFAQPLPQFVRVMKDAADNFALQEDVARAVVEKLTQRGATGVALAVPTKNAEAYEAFLRGRELMNQTSPSWPKAVEAFRRAVELDPEFAIAWAKIARLSAALYAYGFDGRGLSESERAIREAARLGPDLRETHLAQAFLLHTTSAPQPVIERELQFAAQNRPDDPEVLHLRGEMLLDRGDDDGGIRTLQRASAMDARNGSLLNLLGNALAATGRYDEAERAYLRAYDVLGSSVPWTNRARVYFHERGDVALAARTLDEAPEQIRTERYWTGRALLLYMMGDQSRALAAAVNMQPRSGFFRIPQFFTAKMREAAGDFAGARRDFLEAVPLAEQQRHEFATLPTPYAILALVYAGLDRKTEALEVARKGVSLGRPLVGGSERSHIGRTGVGALSLVDHELSADAALAQVHARFGEVDEALAIVAANVAAGRWRRHNLLVNPDWAILRKDPRFRAIAEKAPL